MKRIRIWLGIMIVGLLISGATAIPLESEFVWAADVIGADDEFFGVAEWVRRIRDALVDTNASYPFMAYGTDWLAFAHFVLAVLFVGPFRDPVRNVWVIEFGMIACAMIFPFVLVMGGVREIPLGWQLIDCSFGIVAFLPLWICRREIIKLSRKREC